MGIHTGDSITVAPTMTLSDTTYQRMRNMAIKMMRSIGDFEGGCNVQFAVSPDEKEEIIAIEIQSTVSRSSALANAATGYPITSSYQVSNRIYARRIGKSDYQVHFCPV